MSIISFMTRTCVVATLCATLRRSGGNRSVAAFSLAPKTPTVSLTNNRINHANQARFMSTATGESAASSSPIEIIPRVKTADATEPTDSPVVIKGWVRTVRKQKTLAFVEVNDGSNLKGIQSVLSFDAIDETTMDGTYYFCFISFPSFYFCLRLLYVSNGSFRSIHNS